MALNKTIIEQTPPSLVNKPRVDFVKNDFDALIETKGYKVVWEKAVKCPCSNEQIGNHALSDCENCGGSGWVFINPTETRMVMHSLNSNTQYKEWSEANLGTVSVTAREVDKLSFMDKITQEDGQTLYSETIYPKLVGAELYGFTQYPIVTLESAFLFVNSSTALTKLEADTDYTISNNVFSLVNTGLVDPQVSLRYIHKPAFNVLDIPRESMASPVKNKTTGANEDLIFPIHAIARRSHYIQDAENKSGTRLIDNSY
jgi:hypothetical protein